MTRVERAELDDILSTLKEVEANLAHRDARAQGAITVVWGVTAGFIFAFYHFALANPDPFVRVLGDAGLTWFWLLPMVIGYALTMTIGARMGRLRSGDHGARVARRVLVTLLVPTGVVAAILAFSAHAVSIPAVWLLYVASVEFCLRDGSKDRLGGLHRGFAVLSALAALVLFVWQPPGHYLWAAAWFGLGYAGLGTVRYVGAS